MPALIIANHLLAAGWLAAKLRPLIVIEEVFQRRDSIGRHAAQPLLIAADRRNLRDDGPDPAVGRGEDEHVATGIARAPDADPVRIDLGQGFEEGNGPSPVGDLVPGIDIVADGAIA
jgi:hypothetical protein